MTTYKSNLCSPDAIAILEAYCQICSPFLVLSELWLGGSTQLFCLILLNNLTDSNWLISAFSLNCSAWNQTNPFNFNLLTPSYSLASTAPTDLYCMNHTKWTELMNVLNCIQLNFAELNWFSSIALNSTDSISSLSLTVSLCTLFLLSVCFLESWAYSISDSFSQVVLWFITFSALQLFRIKRMY